MEAQEMKKIVISELKEQKKYSKELEDLLVELLGIVDKEIGKGASFDGVRSSVKDFFVRKVESE